MQAFEHIKESVAEYLEAAYKIAHPAVYAERAAMLREQGTIAQEPFIEATPSFATASKLVDLERKHPQFLPAGLSELVRHGVPVDRFPLYTHQEKALLAAFGPKPNLLVATGTGSGKTESFLLPVLADILREAAGWQAPSGAARHGEYIAKQNVWLHSRRHETRPAAIRGMILYPMNALVNDQLSRLRRILARGASPDWQRRNLNGNIVHFAQYTRETKPTGSFSEKWRRDGYKTYYDKLCEDWQKLNAKLRDTGSWPRPDSPEMLCRWDIQAAPPDILVTNYSMLEQCLVRPIENNVFECTKQWLSEDPEARFTLVLDEAHTYTGAKGTEVAYLVRRLKERLGLGPGSSQFRAIATTASVPNLPGADGALHQFVSDLFGEAAERFSLIRAGVAKRDVSRRTPTSKSLSSFAAFQRSFDIRQPEPAIRELARNLGLDGAELGDDPQVALHDLLIDNVDVTWVRQRTARNATLLSTLSEECWQREATADERERATAGILAAGSFARPSNSSDTPPLLSMRIHAFFRGNSGLWACVDPNCCEVRPEFRGGPSGRPMGKLYSEPRPWCSERCGARVLELFSCRKCGLLFLGGIPDSQYGSLWPWSDDLSGERENVQDFQAFGIEKPHQSAPAGYRSTRTTLDVHQNDVFARAVYEVEPTKEGEKVVSHFPAQCPRCQNWRSPGDQPREIIENLRTKGPRTFSIAIEDAFRVQSRASDGEAPNYGRKALLFSDSRMEAAKLAADIRTDHFKDLFRQLLYRALLGCRTCECSGMVEKKSPFVIGQPREVRREPCDDCGGTGLASLPTPLRFQEMRGRVIKMQLEAGINPKNPEERNYFTRIEEGSEAAYQQAERFFDVSLRRELSEADYALESLGLAAWRVPLPEKSGAFPQLTEEETKHFIQCVVRLLSTEDVLLPPEPHQPWDWPKDLVADYDRCVLIPHHKVENYGRAKPFNLGPYRKLGRYVRAVADKLMTEGRLTGPKSTEKWVEDLRRPLWEALLGLEILTWAGAKVADKVPYGIRVDRFELHPMTETAHRCQACSYVMRDAPLSVCLRCGQRTEETPTSSLASFFRRAAMYALPDSGFDDPYPLRSIEHSAQISGFEARDIERWFQDMFHDHQNHNDYRTDVLSVTTTMEMGIDIGSLLSVGLRNVPPTVANYQQRAGRAGRRGSSVATVLTFAQNRSHDQYYFNAPPEIVTDPPRVPVLYLRNEVIAQRHFRSLVLQTFFFQEMGGGKGGQLFATWGKVADFLNNQVAAKVGRFLARNRAPLLTRCQTIFPSELHAHLSAWVDQLVQDLQTVVNKRDGNDDLLKAFVSSGLLPKYAFPIDTVSLSIPSSDVEETQGEATDDEAMQRDLKIALTEYAPGAEVIRGSFPSTYVYRSVGVYDAFTANPDYSPTGVLLECEQCRSVAVYSIGAALPERCPECQSFEVSALPYLRPPGFTVDAALGHGGREEYKGGRERAGYANTARLLVGQSSFNNGRPNAPFAPDLYSHVRVGDLFTCNRGVNRDFPGFLICPTCGRSLDVDDPGPHRYPASVAPHKGPKRGPRAGMMCPNRNGFRNQVLLGHRFSSEVILLGVDLPETMDAPLNEPSGRAVWYSFGTLVANAATLILQVDPGEIKVGVRAAVRSAGRLHGEVFLYDDVPGGAGYARAIEQNLEAILTKALELGKLCQNPDCAGACYRCVLDYRNQTLHPLLDRSLGVSLLGFLLEGTAPSLSRRSVDATAAGLSEFVRAGWSVHQGAAVGNLYFPKIFEDKSKQRYALWVIHPAQSRPAESERQAVLAEHGLRCAVHTSYDLVRRPFWVFNHIVALY